MGSADKRQPEGNAPVNGHGTKGNPEWNETLRDLERKGLAVYRGGKWYATPKGKAAMSGKDLS
jgi:hypothetical protein